MTANHMCQFMTEVFLKCVPSGSLLMIDSWSGHSKVERLDKPENFDLLIEYIPA